jgi:2,3-bisphosphoglycerate-dependent phosphoglycerate mutase
VQRNFQRPFQLPSGATEVMLIRHGSAQHSPPEQPIDLIDGQSDPRLTELGRRQAQAVAHRLRDLQPAAIFVTPLRRTQETAGPLAEQLGLDPVIMPDLSEVYLGDWEGQLSYYLNRTGAVAQELLKLERWDVIPHAESMDRFSARVKRGMKRLVDAAGPDRTALAVVHGGVIAEACRQVTGSRGFAFLYAENGSLTRIVHRPGNQWALIGFNDTAHLAGAHGG